VTGVVHGVSFEMFGHHGELIRMERKPYRTPRKLIAALQHFYPEVPLWETWTFITFRTYLSEIT
jgi:hypothetical protein